MFGHMLHKNSDKTFFIDSIVYVGYIPRNKPVKPDQDGLIARKRIIKQIRSLEKKLHVIWEFKTS